MTLSIINTCMEKKDIRVHSIKEEYELEFHVLEEAIEAIPHANRMYIPKCAEEWLKENCEADCYLITVNREYAERHYLAMFISPNDAFHYKLVWG